MSSYLITTVENYIKKFRLLIAPTGAVQYSIS